jgi:hypothetical protein
LKVPKLKQERDHTITSPTIALLKYLRKLGFDQDKEFLQESVPIMSEKLMELEVQ